MYYLLLAIILHLCTRDGAQAIGADPDYGYYYPTASQDGDFPLRSPHCSSLKTCDTSNAWTNDVALIHPKAPCQLQVDCVELSRMDDSVPNDAHVLSIRSSYFTSLSYDDMKNFTKLVKLQIEYNDLASIASGTFRAQALLETLTLEGNAMTAIEIGTFDGLSKVTQLKVHYDKIETITSGSFKGLGKLTDLDLSWNAINRLESDVFSGAETLRSIDLQDNNISYIDAFAFRNLLELETLNLKLNSLSQIPTNQLKILPRLSSLELGKNPITEIERSSLKGMKSLSRLDLDRCDIADIAKWAFKNKKLRTLTLSGNLLRTLPNLGRMPRLVNLNLKENNWVCDCKALTMVKWLRRTGFRNLTVVCQSPARTAGENMLQLSVEELCPPPTPEPAPRTPYSTDMAPTEETRILDATDDAMTDFVSTTSATTDLESTPFAYDVVTESATSSGDYYDSQEYLDDLITQASNVSTTAGHPHMSHHETDSLKPENKTRLSHKPLIPAVTHDVDTSVIVAIVVAMAIGIGAIAAMLAWRVASRCQRQRRHDFTGGVDIALSGTRCLPHDKEIPNGKRKQPDIGSESRDNMDVIITTQNKSNDVNGNSHRTTEEYCNVNKATTNGGTPVQSNGHTPKL